MGDIVIAKWLAFYRHPRECWHGLMQEGQREDRALIALFLGCALTFLSMLPFHVRASVTSDIPLEASLVGSFFGWVLLAPLAFYVLALVLWGGLRLFGKIHAFAVRRMLFEAFFLAAPILLVFGLLRGYLGTGMITALIGACWVFAFFMHLTFAAKEAYRHG